MARFLGEAFRVIAFTKAGLSHKPTLLDLADAIEFVSRGMLRVTLHKDAPKKGLKLAEIGGDNEQLWSVTGGQIEAIPNRGQPIPVIEPEIRICADPKCKKPYTPTPRGHNQRYHSQRCRNRHHQEQWRKTHPTGGN